MIEGAAPVVGEAARAGLHGYLLAYLFSAFAVGVACLGVAIGLALRRGDAVCRWFLASYAAFSLMVTASLVLAFADAVPAAVAPAAHSALVYLESFVGRYAVMLTLPLFAHRVFALEAPGRDRVLIAIVLLTAGLQHVTEIVLGSTPWDERGDVFEDVVFAAVVAYTFRVGFSRLHAAGVYRPLAVRFLAVMTIGLPGIVHDLFLSEGTALRFYPLWYCLSSVVVTWTLVERRSALAGAVAADPHESVPPLCGRPPPAQEWGLSDREAEVAGLVARGLSNKAIAGRLHISLNTVKTHLRSVFEKGGVRSRFELISRFGAAAARNHPEGRGDFTPTGD